MNMPPHFAPGLEDVVFGDSRLSLVDGAAGRLILAGYKIEDLAAHAQYEEVAHLLWEGRLPTAAELEALRQAIAGETSIPAPVLAQIRQYPKDANPMAVLRTAVSTLGLFDPEGDSNTPEVNRRKAIRLTGQMTAICAAWPRLRQGLEPIPARRDLTLAENFVTMLTGAADKTASEAINTYMVILADHAMNPGTFTARVTATTGTDLHSAIVAGIGALKGAMHGGANAETMRMFLEIGDPANVDEWFQREVKGKRRRIIGIGHPIYKTLDPRAAVLRQRAEALAHSSGNGKWFELAARLETQAASDPFFVERSLYPNVDYYSAIVLYTIKLDVDMFTPVFAMSRIAGWTAHVIEQMQSSRQIRPEIRYIGPVGLEWTPVDER
jgi:citrate synthase